MTLFIGTSIIGGRNTRAVWTDHRSSSTNQTTFTATTVPFSDESPRRRMIISFRCSNLTANLTAPNACTIGGASAALAFQFPAGTSLAHYQFWSALVPTGTTGTITVTRAADMTGQVLNVWAGYDLVSGTVVDGNSSTFANPSSITLTVQAGGFALAYADATSPSGWAWTGATEDVEGALGTLGYSAATANKVSGTSLNLTATTTVSNQMIASSWR